MVAQNAEQPGRGGAIITMSSVNAVMAIPSIAGYNASKGGVNNLTRRAHHFAAVATQGVTPCMLHCSAVASLQEHIVPLGALGDGVWAYTVVCTNQRSFVRLRCMALALAPHGIRVNAIGPGSIMTEVLQSVVKDKAALSKCAGTPQHLVPHSVHSCGVLCIVQVAYPHWILQT